MPILRIALMVPDRSVTAIAGVVDSGADRTLLPRGIATSLGIPDEDLIPTDDGSGGAGDGWFPTWVLPYAIKGRIIVPFDPPRGIEPWGPEFELTPEFAKDTVSLFGRADFFQAFTVTFEQPVAAHFHLDYETSSGYPAK